MDSLPMPNRGIFIRHQFDVIFVFYHTHTKSKIAKGCRALTELFGAISDIECLRIFFFLYFMFMHMQPSPKVCTARTVSYGAFHLTCQFLLIRQWLLVIQLILKHSTFGDFYVVFFAYQNILK